VDSLPDVGRSQEKITVDRIKKGVPDNQAHLFSTPRYL
jgi:hypothetical protein